MQKITVLATKRTFEADCIYTALNMLSDWFFFEQKGMNDNFAFVLETGALKNSYRFDPYLFHSFFCKGKIDGATFINLLTPAVVDYWRNPTPSEILFGEGAIHYRYMQLHEVCNRAGEAKKYFYHSDGLRYNKI
ncbi:hypothetical protein [Bacteroides sedimenti]|uniref:Uncharacterized protein n=1 Tax=Bacteroides sedimenti TaxID=2136147 RepID=A0ABM8I7L7_9BACE